MVNKHTGQISMQKQICNIMVESNIFLNKKVNCCKIVAKDRKGVERFYHNIRNLAYYNL